MRAAVALGTLILQTLPGFAAAPDVGPAFDTSAFKVLPGSTTDELAELKGEEGRSTERLRPADFASLDARIAGFSKIAKTARNSEERARFLTQLASLYLQKGRALADAPKSMSYPDERRHAFGRAAEAAELILKGKDLTRKVAAYAHYMAGLAREAGDENGARSERHYLKVLEILPKAPYAASVALHLADSYAADGAHQKAVALLEKHLDEFDSPQAGRARLKIARGYSAQKEWASAEKTLRPLVSASGNDAAASEAVKDLAFVAASSRTDPQVMVMADELFAEQPERRTIFLSSAWTAIQKSGISHQVSRVFDGLVRSAAGAEKRIRLWLDETRGSRQPFASARHYSGIFSIQQELANLPPPQRQSLMTSDGSAIQEEVEGLLKSYADTYSGRRKNQENIPRERLSAVLRETSRFHLSSFPAAKNRAAVDALWLDVCESEADNACVYEVSTAVLSDPAVPSLQDRALAMRVRSLVSLEKTDGVRWSGPLISVLEERLKGPKGGTTPPEWVIILAQKYGERLQHDKAIRILTPLFERTKTEEVYYHLLKARLDAGMQDAVAAESVPPEFAGSSRVQTLWRSAAASQLTKLVSKNEAEKALSRLLTMEPDHRAAPEIAPIVSSLGYSLMRQGQFDRAVQFIPLPTATSKLLLYESVIARLGAGMTPAYAEFAAIEAGKRVWLLNLLAISRPQSVVSLMEARDRLSPEWNKPCLLALQVLHNSRFPDLNGRQRALLGMTSADQGDPLGRAESLAASIRFPASGNANKASGRKLDAALKQVRTVRRLVQNSMVGRSPRERRRVLAMAIQLEEKAVTAIEVAPSGMASNEFRSQADEFKKDLEEINLAEREAASVEENRPVTVGSWPWPDSGLKPKVLAAMASGSLTAALLILELNHERGLLSDADYQGFRAGVLLAGWRNEVVHDLACAEIRSVGKAVPKICAR